MTKQILIALALLALGIAPVHAAPGSKTDTLVLNPLASAPTCPAGRACAYALASDYQVYDVDAAGLILKSHAAKSFRGSANCSGLASPANGDVCYDSSLGAFRFYSAGWLTGTTNDSLVVHKAGTETVTGAKTFTASVTLTGGATLGANASAGGFKWTSVGTPTVSGDAVNKGYADALRLYHFHGHADTAAGSQYLGPAAYGAASSVPVVLFTAPQALTIQRIACTWDTAPGGVVFDSMTIYSRPTGGSWAALATTCTATGSAVVCTGTSTASLAQYDSVAVQILRDALSVSTGFDCEVAVSQ